MRHATSAPRWWPVLLLAAIVAGCNNSDSKPARPGEPASKPSLTTGLGPGQQPPQFSANDLGGNPHSLKQHAGKIVVLHFWATWCPYCRQDIPKLKQIHQEHANDGVQVLGISVDEDAKALQNFVEQQQIPYPVIADITNKSPISRDYEVAGIPTTYVVDRRSMLVGRFQGQGDLAGAIKQLLEHDQQPAP